MPDTRHDQRGIPRQIPTCRERSYLIFSGGCKAVRFPAAVRSDTPGRMHGVAQTAHDSMLLSTQSGATMRYAISLVLMLGLAGCSDPAVAPTPAGPASPAVDQAVVVEPVIGQQVLAAQTPEVAAKGATPVPALAAKLALDGEGLRIFAVDTGTSRTIPFGIGKAEALAMLESVRGSPPSGQGENIDCGATNAAWPDGLTAWFARARFVGWSLASEASTLSTADGLKVGTTRSELENGASVARIAPSSLGEEFTAGEVAGLLASADDDDDASVTNLWAGSACIAR